MGEIIDVRWPRRKRNRMLKSLLLLGACLVVAQVFIAGNYDILQIQFGNNTNTRKLLRQLTAFYNVTYTGARDGVGSLLRQNITLNATDPANCRNLSDPDACLPQDGRQDGSHTSHAEGHHEGHDGFALAASVRDACKKIQDRSIGRFYTMQGSVAKRLLYCPMEKIGTTFWRRVLYMLTAADGRRFKNPYDVPIEKALKSDRLYTVALRTVAQGFLKSNSFKFLVVRDPFSRLFSAFVDKLVPPNPYYWKAFGSKTITAFRKNANTRSKLYGHDVTFPEFVKYVTACEKTKRNLDAHFISTFSSCKPCESNYNYIGKMETFKTDALFILNKVGMNSTVEFLSEGNTFKDLTTDDAITDSIYSPFSWRTNILKVISWDKALRRIWLKLQMRGIIAHSETFDSYVTMSEVTGNLTAEQFIEKARKAHAVSKPDISKQQKLEVLREAFMMLHYDDLVAFRNAFKYDFTLYGYDDNPGLLFDREKEPQMPTKYFNYDHLN